MKYERLFAKFEDDTDLHPMISEVQDAENGFTDLMESLNMDASAVLQIDGALGELARAYEERGFLFGYKLAKELFAIPAQ